MSGGASFCYSRRAFDIGWAPVGEAFDRFCTPPALERRKPPPAKTERAALALPFGMLTGFALGPADGAPVLLVHGWGAQAHVLLPLASAAARLGLRAYAFDMPAHGLTREANPDKPTSTMVEWVETLIAAGAALGVTRWQSVIAHSFGALASCFALGPRPWSGAPAMKASSLILIAGASGMPMVVESYAAAVPCSEVDLADIVGGVEAVTRARLTDLAIHAVAQALPRRLLLVHDPADDVTPLDGIRRELAARPPGDEFLREGAGHDAILVQRDLGRAVAAFAAG